MKEKKRSFWFYIDPFNYVDLGLEKWIGKPDCFWKSAIYWIVNIIVSFLLAMLIYKILGLILGTAMPMAIVVSSSMEPNLYRGDVVVLTNPKELTVEEVTINQNVAKKDLSEFAEISYSKNQYGLLEADSIKIADKNISLLDAIDRKNDIIVYPSNKTGRDIIHRAIVKINAKDGVFYLTKGDNHKTNVFIDQDCEVAIVNEKIIAQKPCINLYPIKENIVKGKKIGRIPYIGYIKLVLFQ